MANTIKRAVILAAGLGTRMQRKDLKILLDAETERLASEGAKGLINISGRPFIDYCVDQFLQVGIKHFCFVVRPIKDRIQEYLQKLQDANPQLDIQLAIQKRQKGTADAVLCSEMFVDGEDFLLANYDNVYGVKTLQKLCAANAGACYIAVYEKDFLIKNSNIRQERIKGFGVVQFERNGKLFGIVEKPQSPSDYAVNGKIYLSMNLFRFTPEIFKACRLTKPDIKRKEYELPTAVRYLIDKNFPFYIIKGYDIVVDITERKDIITARKILEKVKIQFLKKGGGRVWQSTIS
jgi:glucose-1-phosphate thymidylyltransferase